MNVASIELCKELYELSGWKGLGFCWVDDGNRQYLANNEHAPANDGGCRLTPAYDLGYLMRKVANQYLSLEYIGSAVSFDKWQATYGTIVKCDGDTPEDAVCRLAIGLFKESVLKREAES